MVHHLLAMKAGTVGEIRHLYGLVAVLCKIHAPAVPEPPPRKFPDWRADRAVRHDVDAGEPIGGSAKRASDESSRVEGTEVAD